MKKATELLRSIPSLFFESLLAEHNKSNTKRQRAKFYMDVVVPKLRT